MAGAFQSSARVPRDTLHLITNGLLDACQSLIPTAALLAVDYKSSVQRAISSLHPYGDGGCFLLWVVIANGQIPGVLRCLFLKIYRQTGMPDMATQWTGLVRLGWSWGSAWLGLE